MLLRANFSFSLLFMSRHKNKLFSISLHVLKYLVRCYPILYATNSSWKRKQKVLWKCTVISLSEESWPLQVTLMNRWNLVCGGILYNENTVITAAHCCYQYVDGEWNLSTGFWILGWLANLDKLSISFLSKIYIFLYFSLKIISKLASLSASILMAKWKRE